MALDKLTIINNGGLSTTSDYRVGVLTATKFVGPIEGAITSTDATFTGSVSIGGTLTYEDVTNIDSVGLVTARNGINISGGNLQVGGTNVINSGRALYNVESVKLADSKELILGSGNDLKIYHSGSHSFIDEVGSGALKIKGDDIRFENASGTEAARIDSTGKVFINGTTSLGLGRQVQINENIDGNYSGISLGRFRNDTSNSGIDFIKSRSNTIGGNTIVQSGDSIGAIMFRCADGTDLVTPAAEIRGEVDGTPGANDMPGRIKFSTTLDGSNSLTEVARFTSSRNLLLSQTAVKDWDGSRNHRLQITGDSSNTAGMSILATQNDDNPCEIVLGKSRSTGNTIVQTGDDIGQVRFSANDGGGFHTCAYIRATMVNTLGSNDLPAKLRFGTATDGGVTVLDRMTINPDNVTLNNNTYLSIPHDEICISFDEGQKMITSNDGQGNFNIICGKNNIAQHVTTSSGNSGISQIELSGDGTDGGIYFGVGPARTNGSSAVFTNGFALLEYPSSNSNYLNGLKYTTGSSTSPSGMGNLYTVIHKGNAENGSWNTDSEAIFKCLGDGGSVALTTNDGGGNANITFNHAAETSDTAGSSWRIRTDIDSANSHFYIQNNTSVSNGQTGISMSTRLEITESGTFIGSGSNNISDQRLKKNIATITNATAIIKGLKGRTFEWKEEAELETGTQYGFIAQEMETVVSDLVSDGTKAGLRSWDKDGNLLRGNYSDKDKIAEYSKGVNVDGVVPILVEALKDALSEIDSLKARVSTLEGS